MAHYSGVIPESGNAPTAEDEPKIAPPIDVRSEKDSIEFKELNFERQPWEELEIDDQLDEHGLSLITLDSALSVVAVPPKTSKEGNEAEDEKIELRVGDRIVAVDGKKCTSLVVLTEYVSRVKQTKLTVERPLYLSKADPSRISVSAAEDIIQMYFKFDHFYLVHLEGVEGVPLGLTTQRDINLANGGHEAYMTVVTLIDKDSASENRFQVGDIILDVDGQTVQVSQDSAESMISEILYGGGRLKHCSVLVQKPFSKNSLYKARCILSAYQKQMDRVIMPYDVVEIGYKAVDNYLLNNATNKVQPKGVYRPFPAPSVVPPGTKADPFSGKTRYIAIEGADPRVKLQHVASRMSNAQRKNNSIRSVASAIFRLPQTQTQQRNTIHQSLSHSHYNPVRPAIPAPAKTQSLPTLAAMMRNTFTSILGLDKDNSSKKRKKTESPSREAILHPPKADSARKKRAPTRQQKKLLAGTEEAKPLLLDQTDDSPRRKKTPKKTSKDEAEEVLPTEDSSLRRRRNSKETVEERPPEDPLLRRQSSLKRRRGQDVKTGSGETIEQQLNEDALPTKSSLRRRGTQGFRRGSGEELDDPERRRQSSVRRKPEPNEVKDDSSKKRREDPSKKRTGLKRKPGRRNSREEREALPAQVLKDDSSKRRKRADDADPLRDDSDKKKPVKDDSSKRRLRKKEQLRQDLEDSEKRKKAVVDRLVRDDSSKKKAKEGSPRRRAEKKAAADAELDRKLLADVDSGRKRQKDSDSARKKQQKQQDSGKKKKQTKDRLAAKKRARTNEVADVAKGTDSQKKKMRPAKSVEEKDTPQKLLDDLSRKRNKCIDQPFDRQMQKELADRTAATQSVISPVLTDSQKQRREMEESKKRARCVDKPFDRQMQKELQRIEAAKSAMAPVLTDSEKQRREVEESKKRTRCVAESEQERADAKRAQQKTAPVVDETKPKQTPKDAELERRKKELEEESRRQNRCFAESERDREREAAELKKSKKAAEARSLMRAPDEGSKKASKEPKKAKREDIPVQCEPAEREPTKGTEPSKDQDTPQNSSPNDEPPE